MSRRNQKHRREARYIAAVCRQVDAIADWLAGLRATAPAPADLFLRPGDKAENFGRDR